MFKIRNDFTLRYNRVNYNYDNLSQAVSYWLNHIKQIDDKNPIGLAYAGLSFSAVALILALYISQRDYVHTGFISKSLDHDTQNNYKFSHIYIAGNTENDKHFHNVPQSYTRTDSWHHAWNLSKWEGREDLNIPFTDAQTIYAYTSGTTGTPKLTNMPASVEAHSIRKAQELFFKDDDYCVFLHGMSHQGVHTTAILPSIFTAKVVSLAETDTWDEEILSASHIQYFYTMKDWYPLPKQVRVITTGGDMLKPVFLEHIQAHCKYEHLYDIYGLTECLPPLAIRDVQSISDIENDFTWVNDKYSFDVNNNDNIVITRPDTQVFITTDKGIKTQIGLQFQGRKFAAVRMGGNLVTVGMFKQKFERATSIVNYAIEIAGTDYILHALKSDMKVVDSYIQDNFVEIGVNYADTINTNGGIKTVT